MIIRHGDARPGLRPGREHQVRRAAEEVREQGAREGVGGNKYLLKQK